MNAIIINGAPGVGKSTLLKLLEDKLSKGYALVDGDDVGRTIPLDNSVEWLNLIQDNIVSCAKNFKKYKINTLIISFVFPSNERLQRLSNFLKNEECNVYHITLICDSKELEKRIKLRNTQKLISVSKALKLNDEIKRLNSYCSVNTTNKSPEKVVDIIYKEIISIERMK